MDQHSVDKRTMVNFPLVIKARGQASGIAGGYQILQLRYSGRLCTYESIGNCVEKVKISK